MKDKAIMKGMVELIVRDAEGNIKQTVVKHNLIVTVGKAFLASWLAAASQANAFMPYTGVGTGTNAPSAGDTALQTQVARAANAPSASTNVLSFTLTFGAGVATGAITEAGLFSASSSGTMFSRSTFTVVTIGSSDTLTVNWQITLS